jgi:hypothetical protein
MLQNFFSCFVFSIRTNLLLMRMVHFVFCFSLFNGSIFDLVDAAPDIQMFLLTQTQVDVHTIVSLLKVWLNELPEPLVPAISYEEFAIAASKFQNIV